MALTMKLNLANVLESQFTTDQRKTLTPLINSATIKQEFGRRVIDRILERTNSGRDKRNNKFVPYSKAYKQSLNFKIFGKTSRVNLRLSGEMQASIGVFALQPNSVTIAIQDTEQVNKARGHVNGSGNLPVRDFWGISVEDQGKILKDIFRNQNAEEDLKLLEELDIEIEGEIEQEAGTQQISFTGAALNALGNLIGDDDGN